MKLKNIIVILILILFLLSGCAGQDGQRPQFAPPQAAQPHAQPTLALHGQGQGALQPRLTPIIQERPSLLIVTPTPTPGLKPSGNALENARLDLERAEKLVADCDVMATREAALNWVVDCTLLYDNLEEARQRLSLLE